MSLRSIGVPAVLVALLTTCGDARADQIPGRTLIHECRACMVRLEAEGRVGAIEDPISFGRMTGVVRRDDGRLAVSPLAQDGSIAIYDRDRRFVETHGTSGDGPGEFRRIKRIFPGSEGTWVVSNGRLTLLDETFAYVRSIPLPNVFAQGITMADDWVAFNASVSDPDRIGLPLHTISTDASEARSFGLETGIGFGNPYRTVRVLTTASDSTFWSARVTRYDLLLWSRDGRPLTRYIREVEWFPDWTDVEGAEADWPPPKPRVTALQMLGDSILLVLIAVPSASGSDSRTGTRGPMRIPSPGEAHVIWDTVVEVVDTRRGLVLASTRVDQFLQGFAGPTLTYGLDQDETGLIVADLWRLHLPN